MPQNIFPNFAKTDVSCEFLNSESLSIAKDESFFGNLGGVE